jgi:hypothetical protein
MDTAKWLLGKKNRILSKQAFFGTVAILLAYVSLIPVMTAHAAEITYQEAYDRRVFVQEEFEGPNTLCGEEVILSRIEGRTRDFAYTVYDDGSWTLGFVAYSKYYDLGGELVAISKEVRNESAGSDGAPQDNGNSIVYQCSDLEGSVDDILPVIRILKPEISPRETVNVAGPSSGVTLNLEGTAEDFESGVDIVEVKVLDEPTLKLLVTYVIATPTGTEESDFSTWSHKVRFENEGTYRIVTRATDFLGNQNWWHNIVTIELEEQKIQP